MNFNTLKRFGHEVYACFQRASDALFNTVDALLRETQAHSFPELTLSPYFQRRWSSLYEAFEDGRIDQQHLRHVFAKYAPGPACGQRLWLGIDASSIERRASPTSRDRSVVYVATRAGGGKPISYGWQFSSLLVLPEQASSWTYVLGAQRIDTWRSAIQVAAEQVREVVAELPCRPIVTTDRWYRCKGFLLDTERVACDKLLRVKRNRVFYRSAPAPTGKRGAPRKDGERFQCNHVETQGGCDEQWQGMDERGQPIEVACWKNLHLRTARHLSLSLFRVIRHGASQPPRDPKESWFLWAGQETLPLPQVWQGYKRRFSQEHGSRFDKQALLWNTPRLRTPEQFERWTDGVAIVHHLLVLARPLGEACYREWETARKPAPPQQVRRALGQILVKLGTPAQAPKPRGKSPGRLNGHLPGLAPRFEVVRKHKKEPPSG